MFLCVLFLPFLFLCHLENASLGQAFRLTTHVYSPSLPPAFIRYLKDFDKICQERVLGAPHPQTHESPNLFYIHTLLDALIL